MCDKYENRDCHKRIVELLSVVDDVCKQYGIKYSLHGGTLLGAVRNGRLIPWDDDADISMMRSEINKLIKIEKENGLPFEIGRSEMAPWLTEFSKVCADGTKESIDVFIWDYISESIAQQGVKINTLRFLQGMLKRKIDYSTYSAAEKALVFVTHIAGLPFTEKYKLKIYDRVSAHFLTGKKLNIHRTNDSYTGVSYIFDSDYMGQFTTILLEGREYMVAKRYVEFLVRSYGDNYLIPPPEADRKPTHDHNKKFLPESERGGLFTVRR